MNARAAMAKGSAALLFLAAASGCNKDAGDGFRLDPASVSFSLFAEETTYQPSQVVTATRTGGSGTLYLSGSYYDGAGTPMRNVAISRDASGNPILRVEPRRGDDLGPGTFAGDITVHVCNDSLCSDPLEGSPATVHVTATVGPARQVIGVTPNSHFLTITANQASLPAPRTSVVSTDGASPLAYTVTVTYTTGSATGWLDVPASGTAPGDLQLAPNTTALPVGVHNAYVALRPANGSAEKGVSVVYTVQ